jgi:hypothetical protein
MPHEGRRSIVYLMSLIDGRSTTGPANNVSLSLSILPLLDTLLCVDMELWSSLLNHHLHRGHGSTFADPAGCSPYMLPASSCS